MKNKKLQNYAIFLKMRPFAKLRLEIVGRFSGFSIKVNPDWNVKTEGTDKKSGISNNTQYDEEKPAQLIIKYDLKFSGLEVK